MAKIISRSTRRRWRKYRGITILLLAVLAAEIFFLIRSGVLKKDLSSGSAAGYAATVTLGTETDSGTVSESGIAGEMNAGLSSMESVPGEESEAESAGESEEESKGESTAETAQESRAETEAEILARLPEKLQLLYGKNPDAHDFVFGYEENRDKDFEIDLSEYENCAEVPLLQQWDKRWGYKEYADELFGLSGCGPTCLSMCAIYLTGNPEYSPEYMRQFSIENDYYVDGSGSKWLLIMEGAELLGFDVTEIPVYEDRVLDNLEAGNPIICIMGPGTFTTTGHFIVLAGTDGDGNITINDPNSITRSSRTWQFYEFEDEIEAMWVLR